MHVVGVCQWCRDTALECYVQSVYGCQAVYVAVAAASDSTLAIHRHTHVACGDTQYCLFVLLFRWDGTPSNTGSTCSHRSSSNTSTVSRANDSSTCNPAAPSSRTCSGTGSSPESSSTDSAAAAESATARPFTKGGLLRSSSRSRGSVTGCIAVRSAVVGGAGLLQGHMNGQAVDVLQR